MSYEVKFLINKMTNICNFCLKCSNSCSSVDKIVKESIEVIFMNVEFAIPACSLICNECIQRVQSAFDFKAVIICNEDFVVSYVTDIPWPEKLIDVYLEKNKINVDSCQNELKICRFCITMVIDNNYYLLEDKEVDTNVREIITTHLSEVDFTITNNPIVCKTCLRKLQDYGMFINSWLDIYNLIKNYCTNNKSDISDLNEVRKFKFENSKKQIFTKGIENGEERNEESRDCVVDNIQFKDNIEVHEMKYPAEVELITTVPVSTDVQIRTDDFEMEESNLKTETLPFQTRFELDNYVLKGEEISIDDESKVFEDCSGINSNIESLHNDNQGINQEIFYDLSRPEDKGLVVTSQNRKLSSSFLKKSFTKMEQTLTSLTTKSVGSLMASRISSSHQLVKTNNGFKCGLCPFQKQFETQVNVHFENSHFSNEFTEQLGVELLECLYCDYVTNHKEYLRNHLKEHFPRTENSYPNWHVIKHSNEFLYKCGHCDYKTKSKNFVKRHLIVHFDENVFQKYEHCDYKTKLNANLKNQLIMHSDLCKHYKCGNCDFEIKYKNKLKSHLVVHSNESGVYKCEHCDFKTKYKNSLKNHLTLHSDETDNRVFLKCEHCDFKTKYKYNLKNHLILHSDETDRVFLKCEHCDYKTNFKHNLKKHVLVHSNEYKLHKCEHCDFKSKYKESLRNHSLVHSNKSSFYKCADCDFKTKYKKNIKNHMVVHSDNVFHKCEHCDFKTKHKNSLKNHLILHSNNNVSYNCEQCDYKTERKSYLKNHLVKHSNKNVFYRCEHCNFKSKCKRYLKRHLMVHSGQ